MTSPTHNPDEFPTAADWEALAEHTREVEWILKNLPADVRADLDAKQRVWETALDAAIAAHRPAKR